MTFEDIVINTLDRIDAKIDKHEERLDSTCLTLSEIKKTLTDHLEDERKKIDKRYDRIKLMISIVGVSSIVPAMYAFLSKWFS